MTYPTQWATSAFGNVNPNWLHCDGGKWPHLVIALRACPGPLGGLFGLFPEDAGGVSVDLGEEVFDSL
jgi:hypothetical protein